MLGGGHVRRRSVGSIIEASPCVRVRGVVRKRKRTIAAPPTVVNPSSRNPYDSGSELENPRGYEAPYNRNSLADEFEAVEIKHHQTSFDASAGLQDRGYEYDNANDNDLDFGYDYDLAGAGGVDEVDVKGNFKSPIIAADVRPAIASASTSTLASAFRFGGERMIRAQTGLLVGRPSLEEGCLTADGDGEDVGMSMSVGGGGDARKSSIFFLSFPVYRKSRFFHFRRPSHTRIFTPFRPNQPHHQRWYALEVQHVYVCLWGRHHTPALRGGRVHLGQLAE